MTWKMNTAKLQSVKPGSVSDHLVCFTDVMATLAEITGATLPEGAGADSFSFLPVLVGSQRKEDAIFRQMAAGGGV